MKTLFYPFIWLFGLYKSGFHTMSKQSRLLWVIALIKLAIMFGVLKMFFFKDFLKTNFETDEQRIEHIHQELTKIKK